MKKIHLYFRVPPRKYRFIPGDQYVIGFIKKLFYKKKISGVEKVFINLYKGFDKLKVAYDINLPFKKINPGEPVVVLGTGRFALQGYQQPNPVIAGISLMTHPSEWPSLCREYPVVKYLQHSEWAKNVYIPYYGTDVCEIWPAGIDIEKWTPDAEIEKKYDFLIYNKIRWNHQQLNTELLAPIKKKLTGKGLIYTEIIYGHYREEEYHSLLKQSKAMIFLCEHESQGFALCEALAMNIPVLAWDQGYCLDPNRFKWNDPSIPATSVPFFDERCGLKFIDFSDFEIELDLFWNGVKKEKFNPRQYIMENLTLEKSVKKLLEIVDSIYY